MRGPEGNKAEGGVENRMQVGGRNGKMSYGIVFQVTRSNIFSVVVDIVVIVVIEIEGLR